MCTENTSLFLIAQQQNVVYFLFPWSSSKKTHPIARRPAKQAGRKRMTERKEERKIAGLVEGSEGEKVVDLNL